MHFINKYDYFLTRLKNLEKAYESTGKILYTNELIPFVIEIFEYYSNLIDLKKIQEVITAQENIDIEALNYALNLFDKKTLQKNDKSKSNKVKTPYSLSDCYDTLKEFFEFLEKDQSKLGHIEVALRIELAADSAFSKLLMNPKNTNKIYEPLQNLVKEKLRLLKDDQIYKLWNLVLQDTNTENDVFVKIDNSLIKKDFFNPKTINQIIDSISKYVTKIRPRSILRMWEEGTNGTPLILPGVIKILSWQDSKSFFGLSSIQYSIFRCLSRIIYLWKEIRPSQIYYKIHDTEVVSQIFNIPKDSRIFDGPEVHEIEKSCTDHNPDNIALLIFELEKLLNLTTQLSSKSTPTLEILNRFKLGLEILNPKSRSTLIKKNELILQKELCQYLLHNGIYSYGKKFGQSEIDLIIDTSHEHIVIETKIYKKLPSDSQIKRHFVQLQSYLDQHAKYQGVLIIYNFTNTLFTTDLKWIQNRFLILPINLTSKTASSRFESIQISECEKNIIKIDRITNLKKNKK